MRSLWIKCQKTAITKFKGLSSLVIPFVWGTLKGNMYAALIIFLLESKEGNVQKHWNRYKEDK